ncbi:hypothetical protein PCANC_25361 [Puccinia coronata f. sp. avenae]|uniref:Uncharacterized protein n=1 Tax=Puccinia coronata f. sp. avenae TaxID=200324 RepID=A0A2N5TU33_9BASI|nr:hypothetical protein PCANC_25361 [Puccinia coronata f. sp. avenae]
MSQPLSGKARRSSSGHDSDGSLFTTGSQLTTPLDHPSHPPSHHILWRVLDVQGMNGSLGLWCSKEGGWALICSTFLPHAPLGYLVVVAVDLLSAPGLGGVGVVATAAGARDGCAIRPVVAAGDALLATVSADGTGKVWSTNELNSPLKLSWGYDSFQDKPAALAVPDRPSAAAELSVKNAHGQLVKITPTDVAVVWSDRKKVAVSYTNSVIKLFELQNGNVLLCLKCDKTFKINPYNPLILSAVAKVYQVVGDLNPALHFFP